MRPSWWRNNLSDVVFWFGVLAAIAAIACGYSSIREGQVEVALRCTHIEQRLEKLEGKIERLIEQQGAWQP